MPIRQNKQLVLPISKYIPLAITYPYQKLFSSYTFFSQFLLIDFRVRKGEEEREKNGRERDIDGLPPAHPLLGIKPTTLASALT